MSSSQTIKRACDACHRRKVKCDGVNPCRNCSTSQLSCTYNAIPQKKGPKGSRAKVICELRETQRLTSLAARVQMRSQHSGPVAHAGSAPAAGLVSSELVKECMDYFFTHLYSMFPVLDGTQLEQDAVFRDQRPDVYCLVTALCAFVLLQPGMSLPSTPTADPINFELTPGADVIASKVLLEEVERVRSGFDYVTEVTHNTIVTSWLMHCCHTLNGSPSRAFFYLREATTMALMARMGEDEAYSQWPQPEATRRRRLYWLLLATERAYALRHNTPLSLNDSIALPSATEDPNEPCATDLSRFLSTINVFKPLDSGLISQWTKVRTASDSFLGAMAKDLKNFVPMLSHDDQLSNGLANQEWLKTVFVIASDDQADHNGLSGMMNELCSAGGDSRIFLCNLVEVAFHAATALYHCPASRNPTSPGPREHLDRIMDSVGVVRSGHSRFLPLVLTLITDGLHKLLIPKLHDAPNVPKMAAPAYDLFDGFGTAHMNNVQMPIPMDHHDFGNFVAGGPHFDRKYSVVSEAADHPPPPPFTMGPNGEFFDMAAMAPPPQAQFQMSPHQMMPAHYAMNMNMMQAPRRDSHMPTPMSDYPMEDMNGMRSMSTTSDVSYGMH